MPVSNGFGSRNFGIIVHSITVGSIPLARSAARARRRHATRAAEAGHFGTHALQHRGHLFDHLVGSRE